MYAHPSQDMSMSATPLDIDTVLYELALARSSVSGPTPNTSSRRPRASSSRVRKPGSAGNSPQRLPRRRTSASHRPAKYRSELYPQNFTLSHAGLDASAPSMPAHMPTRPLSWHPSTMMSNMDAYPSYYSSPHRLSHEYQTVDVNGMPTPMTQPIYRSDAPVDWSLNLDAPVSYPPTVYSPEGAFYRYPMTTYGETASFPPAPNFASDPLSTFSPNAGVLQCIPMPGQAIAFTAPPTPDVLPIQRPVDPLVEPTNFSPTEPYSKEDSADDADDEEELVGMGLYDAPVAPSFLLDGLDATTSASSSPTGKGLKLEETWEPPSEDEEDADADGEAEDAEDDAMETAYESAESLPIEQPSSAALTMPIERPGSLSSPTTTLGMPIEKPEALVSPTSIYMPIQHPDSTALNMPIEHPEPFPLTPNDLSGHSFFLERDGAGMEEDVGQLWLQAMLAHGLGSTMAN